PPPPLLDALQGARRGADHLHTILRPLPHEIAEPERNLLGGVGGDTLLRTRHKDARQARMRRVDRRLPVTELLPHERVVVVRHSATHGVVIGRSRLDQHTAAARSTSGAPCNLAQKLEAPLGGTEIREVDPHVGVYHPDQRHVREIQPLGNHLGADQDVHVTSAKAIEDLGVPPLAAGGIHVHPRDPRRWVAISKKALGLLGTKATLANGGTAAGGTGAGRFLLVAAVVAYQSLREAVVREAY